MFLALCSTQFLDGHTSAKVVDVKTNLKYGVKICSVGSNEIRKAQNEPLIIVCQNLIRL